MQRERDALAPDGLEIELQLRALKEEVEGLSRKLAVRPCSAQASPGGASASTDDFMFASEGLRLSGAVPSLTRADFSHAGGRHFQGGEFLSSSQHAFLDSSDSVLHQRRSDGGALESDIMGLQSSSRGRGGREDNSLPAGNGDHGGNHHHHHHHADVNKVNAWIVEAGTMTGQLARAQKALQDMAAERDSAAFRHREAVRTTELMRTKLEELTKIKELYIQLQQEYASLCRSHEASERIRVQQKEVIQLLKSTSARSSHDSAGYATRSEKGTAPSTHDFFLNYSLNQPARGGAAQQQQQPEDDVKPAAATPRPKKVTRKEVATGSKAKGSSRALSSSSRPGGAAISSCSISAQRSGSASTAAKQQQRPKASQHHSGVSSSSSRSRPATTAPRLNGATTTTTTTPVGQPSSGAVRTVGSRVSSSKGRLNQSIGSTGSSTSALGRSGASRKVGATPSLSSSLLGNTGQPALSLSSRQAAAAATALSRQRPATAVGGSRRGSTVVGGRLEEGRPAAMAVVASSVSKSLRTRCSNIGRE